MTVSTEPVVLGATEPEAARDAHRRVEPALRLAVLVLAWAVIVAQLVGLLLWSSHLVSRASLTVDFANYYQAWFQIAHGHLLPRDTLQSSYYFFQNDGEFIVYLLAPLYWLFPNHLVGYLWLQDAAIAGASAVCLRLVTRLVPWRPADPLRYRIAAPVCWLMTAAFLVLNPWVYWVASFDIHMEPFAVLFVLLGLQGMLARRRSAYVWLGLTMLCGSASSLFVVGAGLTAAAALWWASRRASGNATTPPFLLAGLLPTLPRRAAPGAAAGSSEHAAGIATPASSSEVSAPAPAAGGEAIVAPAPVRSWRLRSDSPWGVALRARRAAASRRLAIRRHRDPAARRHRDVVAPALAVVVGALWLPFIGAIGATQGSPAQGYAYLIRGFPPNGRPSTLRVMLAILEHPATAWSVIVSHGWNLWAAISPDGLIGFLSVPGFLMSAPTLLVNNLIQSQLFSYPSFQSYVVYPFVALGSVGVVAYLFRKRWIWPVGALLAAAMMLNLAGWFGAWFFTTGGRWVQVDPTAAAIVTKVAHEAKAQDEVVSSQGFIGLFSGRQYVYALSGPIAVPVKSHTIWFVFSASQGIETASAFETTAAVARVEQLPGVQQLVSTDGIWVFRWHPPKGWRTVRLAMPGEPFPAWTTSGPAGTAVTTGAPVSWHLAATGATGNVLANDYWYEMAGRYTARVALSSSVPVTAEVWDVSDPKMLAAVVVPPSRHEVTASMTFKLTGTAAVTLPSATAGSGLFRFSPVSSSTVPAVTIVVWTPAGGHESISWTSLAPAAGG